MIHPNNKQRTFYKFSFSFHLHKTHKINKGRPWLIQVISWDLFFSHGQLKKYRENLCYHFLFERHILKKKSHDYFKEQKRKKLIHVALT